MALVPYTFANQVGQIPLSELDANFANCKAFAETAGNVTGNIQANITSVGTLTSLSVAGNVTAPFFIGNIVGNISGNITAPGLNTQVIFNDNGVANAVSGLTYTKSGGILSVAGNVNSTNVNAGNVRLTGIISATGVIEGAGIFTTSGNMGTPPGVTTLRIGNVNPSIIFMGGSATNIYLGNVNSVTDVAGNLLVGATISAGGNVLTSGNFSAAGNIATTGDISASGNINVANVFSSGVISATGNATVGNISVGGRISASGNVLIGGFVSASGNLTAANLSIGGTSTLTGVATAPTAANGTSNTQVATTQFVQNSLLNLLPSGVIVMWSGTIATVPSGWLLCNGTSGTPDLRDRFIVGAGSTYTPGNTGGSKDAIVVAHTHTATSVVSDPGHAHSYNDTVLQADFFGTGANASTATANTTSSNTTGITVSTTINSTGSSGTNANLPPYYALAYIMKA